MITTRHNSNVNNNNTKNNNVYIDLCTALASSRPTTFSDVFMLTIDEGRRSTQATLMLCVC